jgi:hypothetical protein
VGFALAGRSTMNLADLPLGPSSTVAPCPAAVGQARHGECAEGRWRRRRRGAARGAGGSASDSATGAPHCLGELF